MIAARAARYKMPAVGTHTTSTASVCRGVDGRQPSGLLAVVAAVVLVVTVTGYNVDVSVPVLKFGPRSTSYFGFSVAQHGVWQRHSNRSQPV